MCIRDSTLADLHLADVSDEALLEAGKVACAPTDTLHRLPFEVEPGDVAQAFRAVDAYSKQIL